MMLQYQDYLLQNGIFRKYPSISTPCLNQPNKVIQFVEKHCKLPNSKQALVLVLDAKLKVIQIKTIQLTQQPRKWSQKIFCKKALHSIVFHQNFSESRKLIDCLDTIGLAVIDSFLVTKQSFISDFSQHVFLRNKVKKQHFQIICNTNKLDGLAFIHFVIQKIFLKTNKQNELVTFLVDACQLLGQEIFGLVFIDQEGYMYNYAIPFLGGISSSIVDIKIILPYLFDKRVKKVLVFHNHPSGDATASEEDIYITKKLINLFYLFQIELIEHLVFGKEYYYPILEKNKDKFNKKT